MEGREVPAAKPCCLEDPPPPWINPFPGYSRETKLQNCFPNKKGDPSRRINQLAKDSQRQAGRRGAALLSRPSAEKTHAPSFPVPSSLTLSFSSFVAD